MVKAELIKRSPLRIMEKSTRGGVSAGNLGVISSSRGVGKTACLVHIATDQLLQGKHVIHVSFSETTDHIVTWYEAIFKEIAKRRNLESAVEVHDDLIKNRVIMNFHQDGITAEQLKRSLKALMSGGNFRAESIVIDGYDFSKGDASFLGALKEFASETHVAIWMTADSDPEKHDNRGIPDNLIRFLDSICILISLQSHDSHISLDLVKDHDRFVTEDLNLKLDPKTMLISESGDGDL